MLEFNPTNSKFDLYLLRVINAKNEEKRREEFQIEGYGMSLESCFRYIINYRIEKKFDTMSLLEYINEYKKHKNELSKLIKEQLNA